MNFVYLSYSNINWLEFTPPLQEKTREPEACLKFFRMHQSACIDVACKNFAKFLLFMICDVL